MNKTKKINSLKHFIALIMMAAGDTSAQIAQNPQSTLLNINNFSYWIHSDGWANNPHSIGSAGIFPKGAARVIYADGIIWGGKVQDGVINKTEWGELNIRVGGTNLRNPLQPGRIIQKGIPEDTLSQDVRIWRIRRDWRTADLTEDAAEFFDIPLDSVTAEQVLIIGNQYEKDWREWPWQKGAPFYDNNENGIMDENEEPGLAGADQVVWLVANDLNSTAMVNFYGSQPIGLELQETLWAYRNRKLYGSSALDNIIFKRFRLIYKGTIDTPDTARIDSMHFGIWADPDLGHVADDLSATDTTANLVFVYNSTTQDEEFQKRNMPPPALGYSILQGPLAKGNGQESGKFNFRNRTGYRNLGMTANWLEMSGDTHSDPTSGNNYEGTIQFWRLLNGFRTRPEFPPQPWLWLNPATNNFERTKYRFTGDPVTGTGWLDSNAGDRRFMLCTGPFQMALGDTQEVVVAMVGGLGADRLASISVMRNHNGYAHLAADANFELGFSDEDSGLVELQIPQGFELHQNFPNPFNPATEIGYEVPEQLHVSLSIYNLLGQKITTLVEEIRPAGSYSVSWDGKNQQGHAVAGGLYLYQMTIGRFSETKKMLLVR